MWIHVVQIVVSGDIMMNIGWFYTANSGGYRNFKTGGRGAVGFLGLEFVLLPYVFVVRVVNKIHIVNIVFWLKSKYMRVSPLRFTKTNQKKIQTGGRAPGAPVPESAFGQYNYRTTPPPFDMRYER